MKRNHAASLAKDLAVDMADNQGEAPVEIARHPSSSARTPALKQPFGLRPRRLVIETQADPGAPRHPTPVPMRPPVTDVFIPELLGNSPLVEALRKRARRLAATDLAVLICGEPGTGKELLAQAMHDASGRSGRYITLNVASLSRELMDSELFGYVRGAFTNAHSDKEGLVSLAEKGTLFFDEIGELPMELQPKLLRILETRTIRPVGGGAERPIDVRFVAATNRDLLKAVREGTFRRDLYDRLAETKLEVPPLRARGEDLILLAKSFLERFSQGVANPFELTRGAIVALNAHSWPGNVRELQRVIRELLLRLDGGKIQASDIEGVIEREEAMISPATPYRHIQGPSASIDLDISKLLETQGVVTTEELVTRTHLSSSSILRLLRPLRKSGKVGMRRVGKGNVFYWKGPSQPVEMSDVSSNTLPATTTSTLLATDKTIPALKELALKMAQEGDVSRLAFARTAQISLSSSFRILNGLVDEGKLRPEGLGRASRYVLCTPS